MVDLPIYIQSRHSGLVMEFQSESSYGLVINTKQVGNVSQQWVLTSSGVMGYFYIQSMGQNDSVVTASSNKGDPAFLSSRVTSHLDKKQLWTLREPDSLTNPHFVLMSVATGMVLDVKGRHKDAGTRILIYERHNRENQQWSFQS